MANPRHLDIALCGGEAINAYRKEENVRSMDLTGADLSEADLREADLSGCMLNGAKLNGANLVQANLSNATMPEAVAERAVMVMCQLKSARLGRATFKNCNMAHLYAPYMECNKTTFDGSAMDHAVLHGGHFTETSFVGCKLESARFYDEGLATKDRLGGTRTVTELKETNFSSANLRGVNLTKAWGQVVLYGADCTGTNFESIENARLSVLIDKATNFTDAKLHGLKLQAPLSVLAEVTGLDYAHGVSHTLLAAIYSYRCDRRVNQLTRLLNDMLIDPDMDRNGNNVLSKILGI